MKTKILILTLAIIGLSSLAFATTGDDDKSKKKSSNRVESYELRTQIMTEFNLQNAEQYVDINLDPAYDYQLVAIGDEDIKDVEILIRNTKDGEWEKVETGTRDRGMSVYEFEPEKSGKYKFSIKVNQFSNEDKGFVSFMVLRK